MSARDCMVCDQCGKHEDRPYSMGYQRSIESLPPGWWTFAPRIDGVQWLTFCGDSCADAYLKGERGADA